MTAEVKLRTLAAANVTLQGYLGTNPFRWFDCQLPQDQIASGTCVRVQRITTSLMYSFQGMMDVAWPRLQIDVLDPDPELGRTVGNAILAFLKASGAIGNIAGQAVNFLLNRREGMDYQLQPPVYVDTMDVRFFNLES